MNFLVLPQCWATADLSPGAVAALAFGFSPPGGWGGGDPSGPPDLGRPGMGSLPRQRSRVEHINSMNSEDRRSRIFLWGIR